MTFDLDGTPQSIESTGTQLRCLMPTMSPGAHGDLRVCDAFGEPAAAGPDAAVRSPERRMRFPGVTPTNL